MLCLLEEYFTLTTIRNSILSEGVPIRREEIHRALKAGPEAFVTFMLERLRQAPDSEASIPEHSSAHDIPAADEARSRPRTLETGDAKEGEPQPQKDEQPGFTIASLRNKLGIENTTLNKYAEAASVKTPGRGKKNHKYSHEDVIKICRYIIKNVSTEAIVSSAQRLLSKLK